MPFEGAGSSAGRVGQLGRCPWRLGGLLRCCRVSGGGGVPRPPCNCCVGVLRRVRWVRRRGRQLVRVQWWLRGVSRVGRGFGGLGSFGVDVVAGEVRFLVGGGRPLVVGMVLGLSARWCNESGLYSFTGLIFIYSRCGARSGSEVAPGFYFESVC